MEFSPNFFDVTPLGLPIRIAGEAFRYFDRNKEPYILRGGKPYKLDKASNSYVPDNPPGTWKADRWRKQGTPATLGNKPVTWDVGKQDWVYVTPPKPPGSDGTTGNTDGTTGGTDDTTEGRDPRGTIGTEPDITPAETQNWVQDILNKFPEWRQAELDAEMRRYVLTGALRQQGLRELSRRKIEQENIAAWREVEKQRLASQSAQAIALANTAYLAQIPNTGVMEAMNNAMKAGISAGALQTTITPSAATYFS